jgi:hypothetical protein
LEPWLREQWNAAGISREQTLREAGLLIVGDAVGRMRRVLDLLVQWLRHAGIPELFLPELENLAGARNEFRRVFAH